MATVSNRGNATATESVEYVFGESTAVTRNVTVDAGETRTLTFDVPFASLGSANESVAVGTYVHGVRNETGAGIARYLRVTPDVDLAVESFDASAEVSRNRSFVVLATLSNPSNTTITRRVTYRFDGANVTTKTVTVAGDAAERVAYAVTVSDVEAAGVTLREGTTYDHAVVADGGRRDGDAVRFVRGPTGDASALVTAAFDAPGDVRRGETYTANVTVRNVDTSTFDGRLTQHRRSRRRHGTRVDSAGRARDARLSGELRPGGASGLPAVGAPDPPERPGRQRVHRQSTCDRRGRDGDTHGDAHPDGDGNADADGLPARILHSVWRRAARPDDADGHRNDHLDTGHPLRTVQG